MDIKNSSNPYSRAAYATHQISDIQASEGGVWYQ